MHRKALPATLREAMSNSWRGNSDIPLCRRQSYPLCQRLVYRPESRPLHQSRWAESKLSSCIALRPDQQIGIVALANMNSNLILQLCADIDNYLRIGKYADGAGDAITATDTLFVYLTLLLCFGAVVVVRGAFRVYRATAHGPGNSRGYVYAYVTISSPWRFPGSWPPCSMSHRVYYLRT